MKAFNVKKILVPVDFSETSLKALDHAVYMAKASGAVITLIHNTGSMMVNTSPGEYYASSIDRLPDYENEMFERAKTHLQNLAEKIEKKNGIKITAITTSGWVKEEVLATGKKIKADIIVMGTHGTKGFRELIIGSNTFRVINEAKCPVLSIQK